MDRRVLEQAARPLVVGLVVLIALIAILGFAIRDPRPHDIPVGIVAPPPVVQQLSGGFAQAAPGAFTFSAYPSEGDARAAIDRRDIVGAVIVGQAGARLVVAGGAGEALSGALTTAFTNAFQAQGTQLAVEVVHPFQLDDPHGIVLFFLILSTIVASVITGALIAIAGNGRSWAATSAQIATFAVLAGVTSGLMAVWLAGGYGDRIGSVMALSGLLSLAVAMAVASVGRLLGPVGVALAVLVIVPIGLISSGGPLGSEFLPDAYRAIAPWLPVAPAYSALRGALFFDGAGVAQPIAVLAGWAIAGLVLLGLGGVRPSVERRPVLAHA